MHMIKYVIENQIFENVIRKKIFLENYFRNSSFKYRRGNANTLYIPTNVTNQDKYMSVVYTDMYLLLGQNAKAFNHK